MLFFKALENGRKVIHSYTNPSQRGVDSSEYSLLCIGLLGQNPEQRELLAVKCVGSIIRCMMKCTGESGIATYGLRALYNFCYRCEAGQLEVIDTDATEKLIDMVKSNFQGDADCMRNCRRFEFAVKPDVGWFGNVEDKIAREMKSERDRYRPTEHKATIIAEQKDREYDEDDFEGLGDFENENKLFLSRGREDEEGDRIKMLK